MKTEQRLAAILTAVLILSNSFPTTAAETDSTPEGTITEQNITEAPDEIMPEEAPPFHARLEYWMGYTVIGTFMDFTPDIIRIQPLYSWDGENWKTDARISEWNLSNLNTDDEDKLYGLQNQPCLFNTDELLKSYLEAKIDCLYVKLRITIKSGLTYDTQCAVIERGSPQPVPEGAERSA